MKSLRFAPCLAYSVNTGSGNMTRRVRDIDAHNDRVLAASGGLWRFHFGAVAMSDSVPATRHDLPPFVRLESGRRQALGRFVVVR